MAVLMAGLILTNAPGSAHHATAADFDTGTLIVLQGVVKQVEWINPHAWLHLDVEGPDGNTVLWRIEGGSPEALALRKFPKESVTAGIEISITVYPARSGQPLADGATITFKDGKRLFFGGSAPVDGLRNDGKPCILNRSDPGCRRNP
jgi:Family of unknown function (DUF6152)